ncbi:YeeE/YedE family protein [Geminocystis sp. NIES-3709]|uniref:YeeE/YedE family protein n=1 Tax=Geminocystis sp. NIES-3709 TaxID=1617448 RepID=UPI0005FCA595|nr:YeeE/YedE family protein [Geminocystis sp. NIES-3709]BAQ65977.1 GENE II AND X PROTEINS [Geminocystis sp. NIES-3709]
MNNKQNIVALISGLLFGLGLAVSQMIDRERVIGFLDVMGKWDATLMFVLGGAVGVTIISFRFILPLKHPFFDQKFYLPTSKDIDQTLIVGSIIFGIGWGISGFCPGPGVVSLVQLNLNPIIFILAFITGSLVYKSINKH